MGATSQSGADRGRCGVSIRAPVMGATWARNRDRASAAVSIRAPVMGATTGYARFFYTVAFQSAPP